MIDLIKAIIAYALLSLFFLCDGLAGCLFGYEWHCKMQKLYRWLYASAITISPYDLPDIYLDHVEGSD